MYVCRNLPLKRIVPSYYNECKIDTIQYNVTLRLKTQKEKTPNYSGRDSIKGSVDLADKR